MTTPIGLFYGTNVGTTEDVGQIIMTKMRERGVDVQGHDVSRLNTIEELVSYDKLILGTPTWYYGEHQSDWEDMLDRIPKDHDFSHTTVALYGLGDQEGYPDWFLDAMGMIADEFKLRGANIIGKWPTEGYDFSDSKALIDKDYFIGLAIDEDCQSTLTNERIDQWLDIVLPIFQSS